MGYSHENMDARIDRYVAMVNRPAKAKLAAMYNKLVSHSRKPKPSTLLEAHQALMLLLKMHKEPGVISTDLNVPQEWETNTVPNLLIRTPQGYSTVRKTPTPKRQTPSPARVSKNRTPRQYRSTKPKRFSIYGTPINNDPMDYTYVF